MVLEKFARLGKTEQTGESRDWPVNVLVEREFHDIYDRCEKKKSKKIYLERIVIFFFFVDDYIIDYMVVKEFRIQLLIRSRFNYILLTRRTRRAYI